MAERRPKRFVERQAMPVRVSEVASVLSLILLMLIAKRLPFFDGVPINSLIGVTAFAFAIYLALRLFSFELERIRASD
jgi:hypothetical protein